MSFDTKRYRFRYRENRPRDRKVRNLYRGGFDTGFDTYLGALDWNEFRYQTILVSNPYVEVKARDAGFRDIYCWLNHRGVLVVKADRQEPLVIVRLPLAAEIAKRVA